MKRELGLSWSDNHNPRGPITWFARGTLYRLRPRGPGRTPVLYATGPNGYARFTATGLTEEDVAMWANLSVVERTERAAKLLP